ncbi:MAG: hypothetical protein ACREN6_13040 [Gemmatimonadaceae bacterium]
MILLFGPCMFVAPFLVVLIPVAIVLWLPVLAILGLLWLIVWPFAALGSAGGVSARAHAALGRWFVVLLRPWRYFDVPQKPPVDETPKP